jgi:hypothetical protein
LQRGLRARHVKVGKESGRDSLFHRRSCRRSPLGVEPTVYTLLAEDAGFLKSFVEDKF